MYKSVGEDPTIIRVCWPGHADVATERIPLQNCGEGFCPVGGADDGVVIDLVEVVASVVVRVLN